MAETPTGITGRSSNSSTPAGPGGGCSRTWTPRTATRSSAWRDLGFGTPELGYTSLAEMASVRGRFGLGIERDLHFEPKHSLSIYAEAARKVGRIVEFGPELEAVVNGRGEGIC